MNFAMDKINVSALPCYPGWNLMYHVRLFTTGLLNPQMSKDDLTPSLVRTVDKPCSIVLNIRHCIWLIDYIDISTANYLSTGEPLQSPGDIWKDARTNYSLSSIRFLKF
jgi:hypothetical protein